MSSNKDEAGLRALLDLARQNRVSPFHNPLLQSSLPVDAYARYDVLQKRFTQKDFGARIREARSKAVTPKSISDYGDALKTAKHKLKKAKPTKQYYAEKIAKARAEIAACERLMAEQDRIIANEAASKAQLWAYFDALSDDERDWIVPYSEEGGWPPQRYDKAPGRVLFPGEVLPWSKALAIVIEELLGER